MTSLKTRLFFSLILTAAMVVQHVRSVEFYYADSTNCPLCDAIEQLADQEPDSPFKTDVKKLVAQYRIVFNFTEWDNSKRKGWAWGHIKRLLAKHPDQKQKVLDAEFGDSGDDVESFGEGADIYEKVQGLPDVLNGSVDDCPLLKAMRGYYSNVKINASNGQVMQQVIVNLNAFFNTTESVDARLSYYYSLISETLLWSTQLTSDLLAVTIVGKDGTEWGTAFDLTYFCNNISCVNVTAAGLGDIFPSMSDRFRLITPDTANGGITYFYNAAVAFSQSLNVAQQAQFAFTMLGIQNCINDKLQPVCLLDPAPGSACRLDCVCKVVRDASPQTAFGLAKIDTYYGEKTLSDALLATVKDFCKL